MRVPKICPRCCDNWIPNNEHPGQYPGALSRADNKTEICSGCGSDEASQTFTCGDCTPITDWPVTI